MTPMISGLPKNFTLEMELKQDNYGRAEWDFYQKASGNVALEVYTEYEPSDNQLEVYVRVKDEETLINQEFPVDLSQWIREAIWVQNGRLRVYVNGKKVTDNNQLDLSGFETAQLISAPFASDASVSYRLVRIAESMPDFSQVISASGRFVTHGINFDTDSDRLKPESAAVIKSVAQGLQKNPNLKLLIEGHTDSTGSADHNLDLSKRRAEAVKTVLVSQFGVDASRLTTAGLGATKPMGTNDTPQGRAQNRRVEFVRQ
jgi:outer membrane protein OmpA-like peptidoglycan-associated protein